MSSTQSIIVIALVLVILVVLVAVLLFSRNFNRRIALLEFELNQASTVDLDGDIARLTEMDLAGESLITFETWEKKAKSVQEQDLPHLQALTDQARANSERYNILEVNKLLKQAEPLAEQVKEDLANIQKIFGQLLESNRKNKMQFDSLIALYRETRKNILAQSYDYTVAVEAIEDQLTSMESDFDSAKNLSAQGDHAEAKRVLDKIKLALDTLTKQLPEVKQGVHELNDVFPAQFDELNSAYAQMVKQNYYISSVEVENEVKRLRQKADDAQKLLSQLQVKEYRALADKLAKRIDALYDVLAKEYEARPFVDENQTKLGEILDHLMASQDKLQEKLKHIDESYELTHGELDESHKLAREVAKMIKEYQADVAHLEAGNGVYSEIKDKWLRILSRVDEIENREQEMLSQVDALYDAEALANDSLKQFKQDVALIYRRLQRSHLPGNPDRFVQLYTLVVNEITQTSTELNAVRINMESISEEMIQISDDVVRLKKEADEIINSAQLVELTIQYSNKFSGNEQIELAKRSALDLYQKAYNYKDALDTMATALEKVEPGSFVRLEKSYYQDQQALNYDI